MSHVCFVVIEERKKKQKCDGVIREMGENTVYYHKSQR